MSKSINPLDSLCQQGLKDPKKEPPDIANNGPVYDWFDNLFRII